MNQVLHLVRLTIEAETPLSIGSGDLIAESDVALLRDANGLPIIPGSSLRGVLRHLWAGAYGGESEKVLFGFAANNAAGQTGRVIFGFGLSHNSRNEAQFGRLTPADIKKDTVLAHLAGAAPVLRHHVKLDHRSVAEDGHKFDRSGVPAGVRFSFELAMWGQADTREDDKAKLARLVGLIKHPAFRLGGGGRRGYGKVKFSCPPTYEYLEKPCSIRERRREAPSKPLAKSLAVEEAKASVAVASVTLTPIGPWRISWQTKTKDETVAHSLTGGTRRWIRFLDPQAVADDIDADPREAQEEESHPLRESCIVWNGDTARVEKPQTNGPHHFAIPGSAIRGALAHRALFHWNAANERLIDVDDSDDAQNRDLQQWQEPPEAFYALFGVAKEPKEPKDPANGEKGQAAALFVQDGRVEGVKAIQAIPHSSIDRFTGGVRSGVLYTEEVAIGGTITFELVIMNATIDAGVRKAFLKALRDLTSGRLAFGAKSHGFATGEAKWSEGNWADAWGQLP